MVWGSSVLTRLCSATLHQGPSSLFHEQTNNSEQFQQPILDLGLYFLVLFSHVYLSIKQQKVRTVMKILLSVSITFCEPLQNLVPEYNLANKYKEEKTLQIISFQKYTSNHSKDHQQMNAQSVLNIHSVDFLLQLKELISRCLTSSVRQIYFDISAQFLWKHNLHIDLNLVPLLLPWIPCEIWK